MTLPRDMSAWTHAPNCHLFGSQMSGTHGPGAPCSIAFTPTRTFSTKPNNMETIREEESGVIPWAGTFGNNNLVAVKCA